MAKERFASIGKLVAMARCENFGMPGLTNVNCETNFEIELVLQVSEKRRQFKRASN